MLIHLLRLLQGTFNQTTAVFRRSEMINTVTFWDVSQYLCSTGDTIFKVFLMEYADPFSCLTIHFHGKRTYFFQVLSFVYEKFQGLADIKPFSFSLDFMLKGKRAVGKRLREDNSDLSSQLFLNITETMWHIFWYYTLIFIVKMASEHYRSFFVRKKMRPSLQWKSQCSIRKYVT